MYKKFELFINNYIKRHYLIQYHILMILNKFFIHNML